MILSGQYKNIKNLGELKLENKQEFDENVKDEDLLDAIVQGLRAAIRNKPVNKVQVEDTLGAM